MTAELAVALPAVVLMLALCLAGVQVGAVHVRVTAAAADAARALGRGESDATATRIAQGVAGVPVALTASRDGEFVCAAIAGSAGGLLAAIRVQASSCAMDGGR
ncbi:MAG TPA: TadE family type IV pilus minor pilin [Candidatus Lumbricidophila sp.]|nr:TadE family type IV pilus minor pilin [Candidatus Lumbricidophila sp.]